MSERSATIDPDLASRGEPHEIMRRLVTLAARTAGADRCTLTSIDQHVFRVEASYEVGGPPDFVGREYSLTWLSRQPLLQEAITSGTIVTGGGFGGGDVDPGLAPALQEVVHTGIVPLTIGDSVGAVLILSRKSDVPFVAEDLEGLQQFAVLAVLALRNARLIDEVRNAQQRGLEALTMMSRHVALSVEPAAFLERMSETIATLAHAERAAFWQLTGDELVVMHGWHGAGLVSTAALRLPVPSADDGDSLAPALYEGKALRAVDGSTGGESHLATALSMMGARDLLVVPWRTAAGPLGLLIACNSESGFIEEDEWMMRLAARASALVWQGYAAETRVEQLQATEVRRLEAHAARMAELDQQKSEFLQLASHELRSPITLVSGYLSMLEDGSLGQLPETAAKVVPLMSTRMRQMAQLVERMLAASRMEVHRRDAPIVDVRIDDIARAVVASQTMDEDGRRVEVQATGELHVRADPASVETMLNNLVSNALKYSAANSDIAVVVREEPGWAVVDVVDQGIGISRREMSKLFQPFGRLDSALSAGIEGTGLGLHLSRNLALSLGGDIEVRSRPGKGSTFTLRLPVQQPDPTGSAES